MKTKHVLKYKVLTKPPQQLKANWAFHLTIERNKPNFENINGKNVIIAGNFNFDGSIRLSVVYKFKHLFELQM